METWNHKSDLLRNSQVLEVHALKQTASLPKLMVGSWKMTFPFGALPIFRGTSLQGVHLAEETPKI